MQALLRLVLAWLGGCTVAAAAAAQPAAAAPAQHLLVVQADPPQATLVDADRLRPVGSVALPRVTLGAPRFSPDGRYAWFGARDGWISRVDLRALRIAGEARVGDALASFALSSDGRWLLAGNETPPTLVLLDAELNLVKTFAAATADGKRTSRVGTVTDAAPRTSFVVALRDIPEMWEISYNPRAEDIYAGLVHDFRMGEGVPMRGFHNARRSQLVEPLVNLFFDDAHTHVVGSSEAEPATAQVVNLDVRRRIATLALRGRPVLASGLAFGWQGTQALAVPNAELGALDVIDMRNWKLALSVPRPGPGAWLAGRAAGQPRWWADAAAGAAWTAFDKATLAPGATLQLPAPAVAPLTFTADGRRLLACTSGLVLAYDAATLAPAGRLALASPITDCALVPAPR